MRARYFDGNGNRVRSGPWSDVVRLAVAAQTDATLQWEELLRQDTPCRQDKVRVRARYFDGNGNRVRSGPWRYQRRRAPGSCRRKQTDATLQDSDEEARRHPNSWEELLRQVTVGPAVTNAGTGGITGVGGVNHVDGPNFDVTVTFSAPADSPQYDILSHLQPGSGLPKLPETSPLSHENQAV